MFISLRAKHNKREYVEKLKNYLEKLSQIPSVSGLEERLGKRIISIIKDKVDTTQIDNLGNVIAFKKGCGKHRLRILLEAHMDQIGLMVTKIEENGILRFTSIGGVNPLTLFGKRVRVFGKQEIYGIIGTKPPHLMPKEEVSKVTPTHKLFIDIGFPSMEEALKVVTVGDVAVLDYYSDTLLYDHFSSSGLDNKAGVLTLVSAIDLLDTIKNYHDIYILFAVQEEVGLRGAKVGGYTINPDIAVVCDVTFGDPDSDSTKICTGKGPVIGKGPNYFPPLVKRICQIAKREDIPIQEEVQSRPGGTDAFYFQITKQGVYTAEISVPLRYMHSPVEIINLKDVYRASKLVMHLMTEKSPIIDSKSAV